MTSAIGMSEGMNDVKRFDCLDWRYSDDGSCVDYADYEALQQERDALQQQLAAAREALQAAEADAARYRWLRGEGFERPASMWVIDYATKIPVVHTDLDAAIDATLQRDRQP